MTFPDSDAYGSVPCIGDLEKNLLLPFFGQDLCMVRCTRTFFHKNGTNIRVTLTKAIW